MTNIVRKFIPSPSMSVKELVQEAIKGTQQYCASNTLDKQEGGDHYKKMPIQPWQYIAANKMNYWEGNVVKYVTRHQSKAGLEDLKKARHYLDYLIENYNETYKA